MFRDHANFKVHSYNGQKIQIGLELSYLAMLQIYQIAKTFEWDILLGNQRLPWKQPPWQRKYIKRVFCAGPSLTSVSNQADKGNLSKFVCYKYSTNQPTQPPKLKLYSQKCLHGPFIMQEIHSSFTPMFYYIGIPFMSNQILELGNHTGESSTIS